MQRARRLPGAARAPAGHPRARVRGRRRGVPDADVAGRRARRRGCSASSVVAPRPSSCAFPPRTAPACRTASTSSTMGGVPEAFVTAHDALVTRAQHVAPASGSSSTRSGAASEPRACSSPRRSVRSVDRDRPHRREARTLPCARPRRGHRPAESPTGARHRRDRRVDRRADRAGRRCRARSRRRQLRRGRHRRGRVEGPHRPHRRARRRERAAVGALRHGQAAHDRRARCCAARDHAGEGRRRSPRSPRDVVPLLADRHGRGRSSMRSSRSNGPRTPTTCWRPTRPSARSSSTAAEPRRRTVDAIDTCASSVPCRAVDLRSTRIWSTPMTQFRTASKSPVSHDFLHEAARPVVVTRSGPV